MKLHLQHRAHSSSLCPLGSQLDLFAMLSTGCGSDSATEFGRTHVDTPPSARSPSPPGGVPTPLLPIRQLPWAFDKGHPGSKQPGEKRSQ